MVQGRPDHPRRRARGAPPVRGPDADFLNDQSAAYTRALTLPKPAGTLLAIGKALHDWLDRKDLLAQIIGESGPVSLDLAVAVRPDAKARAFVAAPWELLTDATGLHLAFDATRAYSPARRFGAPGTPWEPAHRDLSVLFMAAAPEGVSDLDYEREEALILDAVERLPCSSPWRRAARSGPWPTASPWKARSRCCTSPATATSTKGAACSPWRTTRAGSTPSPPVGSARRWGATGRRWPWSRPAAAPSRPAPPCRWRLP